MPVEGKPWGDWYPSKKNPSNMVRWNGKSYITVFLNKREMYGYVCDGEFSEESYDDQDEACGEAWAEFGVSVKTPPPPPPPKPPPFDPYAVLGVERGATSDEIRSAYIAQCKLYHPDRVDDLGVELKKLAHEKMIAITRAYKQLTG